MLGYAARYWRPFQRLAQRPAQTQASTLLAILRANRSTTFGQEHRFSDIRTADEFRAAVPVHDYEALRPHVERQRRTGHRALTEEPPLFYARTSGSSGAPKLVPVTRTSLRHHRAEQALFTWLQHRARPDAFAGSAWGIMGAAVEGRLDSGHAVGSVSGYLYESLPAPLRSRFVVPPAVSRIEDYDTKYLVILRLALTSPPITYLGAPNPSTFLRLLTLVSERRDVLAHSLESGSLDALGAVDGPIHDTLRPLLRVDRRRAMQLGSNRDLTYRDLWPEIRLLTTWTGGSCGIALDALRPSLPRECSVMELGYQATEMRGTIALEAGVPGGLPPLHHHFFEFIEQGRYDAGASDVVDLAELKLGRRYYVLVTTAAGLYRYFMNDIVEVTGHYQHTPLLRFVQKGKGVTNLVGEKLYEGQVIEAVTQCSRRLGITLAFFQMIADEHRACYRLVVEGEHVLDREALGSAVDAHLGELNIEYQSKRASARLAPIAVGELRKGAADAYKAACVQAGQREGQFKPSALLNATDVTWAVDDYVVD